MEKRDPRVWEGEKDVPPPLLWDKVKCIQTLHLVSVVGSGIDPVTRM